ncbi:MAG: Spy/CpxP family protein refolding chaperone [Hyphomicrobiales bacterium]
MTQSNTSNRTLRNTTAVQTNAQGALRRNGTAGITTQAARQGRFASRFSARAGNTRFANVAAHRAWRRGLRAGFVSWYGPVFWPYAYSDIFDYAFWPGGYDDGYWDYAYDGFVDGLFWGEYGPPDAYAYAPAPASRSNRVSYAGVQELCTQPGTGITAWPYADIERKVGLNADQKQLLDGVRKVGGDAAATFKASCPAENMFPLTPPGRLTAMTGRLQATLDAVKIVQPALDKFYNSLSDEQKERFNALGPKHLATNAEANAALPQDSKSCSEAKPGLANLPIEKIADVVKPTDAQQDAFKQLQDATGKAVSLLQAACPEDVPITPPGRLTAMEKRLQAMVDAAKTVKPALDGFYASLSNEQKARFDRIGQQLTQTGG